MSEESFRELLKEAKELKIEDLAIIQALINHEHLLLQQCKNEKKELIGEFLTDLKDLIFTRNKFPKLIRGDNITYLIKKWEDKL